MTDGRCSGHCRVSHLDGTYDESLFSVTVLLYLPAPGVFIVDTWIRLGAIVNTTSGITIFLIGGRNEQSR